MDDPRSVGRPTKKTEFRLEAFLASLRGACTRMAAASACGVTWKTMSQWIANDPELALAAEQAEAEGENALVSAAYESALGINGSAKDPKMSIELLKRRHRAAWGDSINIEKVPDFILLDLLQRQADQDAIPEAGLLAIEDGFDDL